MTLVDEHAACLTTSAVKDFAWSDLMTIASYSPDT
jgi:hypothetical protein